MTNLHSAKLRYPLLVFNCLLGFGCYYNVDVPSALQADLQGQQINDCGNVTSNVTNCKDCLGLGPLRYNQLYLAYSWMNALCALPAGFIIDKIGNRVGALVFSTISSLGTFFFTLSTFQGIRMTSFMFPLMMIGRLLLGAGTGSLLIIQERMVCFWFQDKITIATGFIYLTLRFGNVSNFLLTANVQKWKGITSALWIGFSLSCVGVVSAVGIYVLDYLGNKTSGTDKENKPKQTPATIRDILLFPVQYWMLCVAVVTFYSSFLPFVSNGSKYIQDQYGYSRQTSSYINGAVYDIALVMSPLGGIVFTKINVNGLCLLITVLVMMPVFLLLAFCPSIHPLVFTIWIGVCAILGALFLWPFINYLVPHTSFGTAIGVVTFIQGLGVGLTNLGVGKLLGSVEDPDINTRLLKYKYMFLLLFALSCICMLSVLAINIVDLRGDRRLNARLARRNQFELNTDEKSSLLHQSHSINN